MRYNITVEKTKGIPQSGYAQILSKVIVRHWREGAITLLLSSRGALSTGRSRAK